MASIINSLGNAFTHTIVALNGNQGAADRLAPDAAVEFLQAPPGRGDATVRVGACVASFLPGGRICW